MNSKNEGLTVTVTSVGLTEIQSLCKEAAEIAKHLEDVLEMISNTKISVTLDGCKSEE
jgi:hypothetical protein